MERPTCETCPHWQHLEDDYGMCVRYPPKAAASDALIAMNDREHPGHGAHFGSFPETLSSQGCGEHPSFAAYAAEFAKAKGGDV